MGADRVLAESRELIADRKRSAACVNVLIDSALEARQRCVGLVDPRHVLEAVARELGELAKAVREGMTAGEFEELLARLPGAKHTRVAQSG